MPIPDYQSIMLPFLKLAGDKKEHSMRNTFEQLANQFQLTEEEKNDLLPSGTQPIFENRVGWARTYLKKAGLVESQKRGYFNITGEGLKVLEQSLDKIDVDFLMQFPDFVKFRAGNKKNVPKKPPGKLTPEESLEYSYQSLREEVAEDLIKHIKDCSPEFFEKLVVDLLLNMGYGGSRKDAGEAIGKSNDGGIDGIINEDKLGLDTIYIQAKRWENTVSRPEIQKFAGALQGQKAKKGVFFNYIQFLQRSPRIRFHN